MSWTHRQSKLAFLLVMIVLITIPVGVSTAEHTTSEGVFEVEITAATDPVAEGDEVVVTATVENTGEESDSQQIHLKNSENDILDSVSSPALTLDPGESEAVTLTWQTESGDADTHDLRVSSDDEATSESVTVEQTADGDDGDTESETESSTSEPTSGVSIQSFTDDDDGGPSVAGGQGTYLGHSYFPIDGTTAQILGYDVENVTFAEPTDGFVLISAVQTLPTDVNQTEDVVALYDIDVSKQVDQTAATIEFGLDAGALDGADADDVVVRRWNGSAWNDLPTNATVDGDVHVEAETTRFSVFAVTTGNETAAATTGSQGPLTEEAETAEQIENETDGENSDTSDEPDDNETEKTADSESGESETEAGENTESGANETIDSEERFAATALLTHTDNSAVEGSQSAGSAETEQTETPADRDSQSLEIGIITAAILGTLLLVTYRRRTL